MWNRGCFCNQLFERAGGGRRAGVPGGQDDLERANTDYRHTDGLTDAVNLTGELFGKERLEATLDGASARSPEEIVDHVWAEIGAYSAGAPAADDMTCLVLLRRR